MPRSILLPHGGHACIYTLSKRAATSGCTSAARTRSILFAAQFSRIDISSGVSRRSTAMSSNSTVVNVSESHPSRRVARARGDTAGSFLFLLATLASSSSSSVTFFLLHPPSRLHRSRVNLASTSRTFVPRPTSSFNINCLTFDLN